MVENIEVSKFKIGLSQVKDLGRDYKVTLYAALKDGNDFREEDAAELKALLLDLGKWDNLVESAKNLIAAMGLSSLLPQKSKISSRSGTDYILSEPGISGHDMWQITIGVSSEERKLNGGVTVAEIEAKLENLEKWQGLRITVEQLKPLLK